MGKSADAETVLLSVNNGGVKIVSLVTVGVENDISLLTLEGVDTDIALLIVDGVDNTVDRLIPDSDVIDDGIDASF